MDQQQPPFIQALLIEHRSLKRQWTSINEGMEEEGGDADGIASEKLQRLLKKNQALEIRHSFKERNLLFPRIRRCCPPLGSVLDRLEFQQNEISKLEMEMPSYSGERLRTGSLARRPLGNAIQRFVAARLDLMTVEENYIFPVAAHYLSPVDWSEISSFRSWNLCRERLLNFCKESR